MFENVIAQPATKMLVDDITTSRLPPSILFSGPTGSGKLTAALELARVLSCENKTAEWTCQCSACLHHKELSHSDLILMGPRDSLLEIYAASDTLIKTKSLPSRYLFIRAIKKLSLRFNAVSNEQDEPRMAKVASSLCDIDEKLEEIHVSRPLPSDIELEKLVEQLLALCEKLEDSMYDALPVNQVRSVSHWVRLTAQGKTKTVIIDNADLMQESARNAFLKVLEEPPTNVVFILTTSRRGAILPTILSRVRTYAFIDRSLLEQQEVITRVYKAEVKNKESLSSFFFRYLPVSEEIIQTAAAAFFENILSQLIDQNKRPLISLREVLDETTIQNKRNILSPQEISSLLKKGKTRLVWHLFYTALSSFERLALRLPSVDAREVQIYTKWSEFIRSAVESSDIYNISPASVLEDLLVRMRDSV